MTLEEANERYLNKDIIILKTVALDLETTQELVGKCFKIIEIQLNEGYQLFDGDDNLKFKYFLNVQPLCYRYNNLEVENNPQYWFWKSEIALITEIEQQRTDNLKQILI